MLALSLVIAALLPTVGLLVVALIVALGRAPGYRRRPGSSCTYDGPERRCPLRKTCATRCSNIPEDCPLSKNLDSSIIVEHTTGIKLV